MTFSDALDLTGAVFREKLYKEYKVKCSTFTVHIWPEISPDFYPTPFVTSNIGYNAKCLSFYVLIRQQLLVTLVTIFIF